MAGTRPATTVGAKPARQLDRIRRAGAIIGLGNCTMHEEPIHA